MDTIGPNIYSSKGVLVLDEITPVITALFGDYGLHQTPNGSASFRYNCHIGQRSNSEPVWGDIFLNLLHVAHGAGLDLPGSTARIEILRALSAHLNGGDAPIPRGDIEDWLRDGAARPVPEKLFVLAKVLNDGHGLKAILTEGAWRRNGDLGGQGLFLSMDYWVASSSVQALSFGIDVFCALLDDDVDKAAVHFVQAVDGLLSGIVKDETRRSVRSRVAGLLTLPPAVFPCARPTFGPASIDFDATSRNQQSTAR